MQLYASAKPSEAAGVRCRLNQCAERPMSWCASRRRQLNGDKSEIAWLGYHVNLRKIISQHLTLPICCDVVQPNDVVRRLGVWEHMLLIWL